MRPASAAEYARDARVCLLLGDHAEGFGFEQERDERGVLRIRHLALQAPHLRRGHGLEVDQCRDLAVQSSRGVERHVTVGGDLAKVATDLPIELTRRDRAKEPRADPVQHSGLPVLQLLTEGTLKRTGVEDERHPKAEQLRGIRRARGARRMGTAEEPLKYLRRNGLPNLVEDRGDDFQRRGIA
jgi:hypothetical protein